MLYRIAEPLPEEKALQTIRGESRKELSERELAVFLAVVMGDSRRSIAVQMSLSIKTIDTYHSRILNKLEVANETEMIHYAIYHGYLEKI